ncbi:UDP-N-acetylmuramoylalanyl-D-glutamate--2,6-diaminopimelate ligase [Paenibacillaceae bacterium GAS479]|nr:UDP-N-acetylmuramoylalanyl-D-glutamate--2,6-diaminopimelate ligase [Paenibacillaceae bacterium GAS479]
MQLKELIDQLTIASLSGDAEVEITGISIHSQQLQPGELFVCIPGIPGLQEDRHQYIDGAIKSGAAALIVERDVDADVPVVKVPDARYALALLSAHFYGYPSQELKLIGVTGTNGKTTTSYMIESILAHAGYQTGLMGNIGTKLGSTMLETDINTQDPHRLQANLKRMTEHSVDYCVMEASSQGLHMGRVIGCEFRTAVFTNLTQDHLDYHGSMESYLAAKGLLFSRLGNSFAADPSKRKFAILNADDQASGYFKGVTSAQVITYGVNHSADIMAKDIRLTSKGTSFMAVTFVGDMAIEIPMIGKFNVYNALAAIGAALVEQVSLDIVREGLAELKSVAGRMEVIDENQDYLVLADYAHTPDGLENALSTLREFAEQRIITVFGCGGDRDRTKRPIMGALAAKYSDYVIVTSDNPRSEEPIGILQDVERGLITAGATTESYTLIADRGKAIENAINMANSDDIVIIAGKGHETYQIMKDRTIPFDDREEARKAIQRKSK